MTGIKVKNKKTFTVPADLKSVYQFFINPDLIREETTGLVAYERLDEVTAAWTLTEKNEMGIKLQPKYTLCYSGNGGDAVCWNSIDGNIAIEGRVELKATEAGATKIIFEESVCPDLPITPILAKIIQPIVFLEAKHELETFCARVKRRFNAQVKAPSSLTSHAGNET